MPMRKLVAALVSILVGLPAVAGELPIRPDPKLTPGAVLTADATVVCVGGLRQGAAPHLRQAQGGNLSRLWAPPTELCCRSPQQLSSCCSSLPSSSLFGFLKLAPNR